MKKNKLFLLFNVLSAAELKKLEGQLKQEHTKKNDKVVLLFDFLKTNKKKLKTTPFDQLKNNAFTSLYPKEPYASGKLRSVMAGLTERIEDFLLLKELKEHKEKREAILREIYKRKNMDDLFFASIGQAQKKLNGQDERDTAYNKQQLALAHANFHYDNEESFKSKTPHAPVLQMHDYLDVFYLISKLRYSCEMIAIRRIREIDREIPFFDEVLDMSTNERFSGNWEVCFWRKLVVTLKTPSEASYYQLKQDFFDNTTKFNKEERLQILETLINLYWHLPSVEKRNEEIFALYYKSMEHDILLLNGSISPSHYFNILDLGSSLKEVKKLKEFESKYVRLLHADPSTKENIICLAKAFMLFAEGKFAEILSVLIYLNYEDVTYGFRAYTLLIKSCYEEKKFNILITKCESFTTYVSRKKRDKYINQPIYEENMNFIKIVKKLPLASKSKHAAINKDALLKELKGMTRVKARSWLLEKIRLL